MESKSSQYIRKFKTIRIFGLISSAALMTLIISTILPVYFEPDSASSATPVASETTITISSDESVNLDLVINSSTGTFATSGDSDLASFTVTTNNYTGYTLSISGRSSNDEENKVLVNSNTSSTLSSISSAVDSSTFANSSDLDRYNNKWGFVASKYNSTTSSYDALLDGNYQPAPTKSGTVLNKTTCANNTTSCPNSYDTYAIGLGARVDYTMPSGVYSNTYTLTAVGNPVAYAINYTDDSGDTSVANLPNEQVSDGSEGLVTSVVLAPDSTPTRTGYLFKSWCEGSVNTAGTLPAATTCTGTEYSAGDTIYLDQTTGNEITLYAVWTISIQSLTASMCSTLATSSNYQTFDLRDNKYYNVRYINGNCWMTSNLRFTGTPKDAAGKMTLDSTTSNVKDTYTPSSPLTITYYDLEGTEGSSATGKCYGDTSTTTVATGAGYTNPCMHAGSNAYTDGDTVWYNYPAATAGTITGLNNTNAQVYDICPAGWKLPSYTEAQTIGNNSSTYVSSFNAIYGGHYEDGVLGYTSTIASWWSNASSNAPLRYNIYHNSSNNVLNVQGRWRFGGSYIRCIRGSTKIGQMKYMQDFAQLDTTKKSQVLNSMTTNQAYTLTDLRDSQTYSIAKMKDNNIWMADNLNLGATTLSTNLTSANTNLSTTITASTFNSWKKTSGSGSYTAAEYIPISGTDSTSRTKYGTLYNFCAVSAKTICNNTSTTSAQYDLCPSSWRLPTLIDRGEFYALYQKYYSYDLMRSSLTSNGAAFALPGYFYDGAPSTKGANSYYWTSTVYSATSVYRLNLANSTVGTSGGGNKNFGFSARCLVK